MQKRLKTFTYCLWSVSLFLGLVPSLEATMVRPLSMQEMADRAERIFLGQVIEVREGEDEHGAPVTFVSFAVARSIKGQVPQQLTIKQLGGRSGGGKGKILRIPGLPMYKEKEEVILFLHGTSGGGFTSPVGLGQGKFIVVHQGAKAFVINELSNVGPKSPSQSYGEAQPSVQSTKLPERRGLIELKEFLSAVERLVSSSR
jgi:hypothetical protein